MLNQKFLGEIQSVSAAIKTAKDTDGTKIKVGVYKVKLASADIDYQSMAKFNPNVSATLLNIQPMPMKGVNFGDQSAFKMSLKLYSEQEQQLPGIDQAGDFDAAFGNVLITNLTAKIVDNLPVYIFSLEIPMAGYDGKFLFKNIKSRISFEFGEMEKNNE